jgi:opacity protein-like surface antigen
MHLARRLLLAALVLVVIETAAFADATAFIGTTTTPSQRLTRGAAIGFGLLILGFEFEYADTSEDESEAAPSLRTGMGNVLLQTPFPMGGVQLYATAGAGGYRERLGQRQETHVGINTGGGIKFSLLGPLRVRGDYRVFKLRGDPLHSVVHRFYAGVNLAF